MTTATVAAWRSLLDAHAELVDVLGREMEEVSGIPLTWYDVLVHLREADGRRLRMHELAETRLLSRSATTRFIDRMEEAGLVRREACRTDRRGVDVVLTAEGEAALREAAGPHLAAVERHVGAHLSGDEAEALAAVLTRIADAARGRHGARYR